MVICRPWITLRNGRVLYASEVGKQAFCFDVDSERSSTKKEKRPRPAKKEGVSPKEKA
jgi:hypothetical protein